MAQLSHQKLLGLRLLSDDPGCSGRGSVMAGLGKPGQPYCLVMEGNIKNRAPVLQAKESGRKQG